MCDYFFENYREPTKSVDEKPIKDDQALRTQLKRTTLIPLRSRLVVADNYDIQRLAKMF